ncbi:MAG: hypothetical protein JKY56_04785 [Kofleriaceae bacterium]|nr:hypothetical protein [Kofleriaceae bacterium]
MRSLLSICFALSLAACGSSDVELNGDGGVDSTGDGGIINDTDSGVNAIDAGGGGGGGCTPTASQCNNCQDDDADGLIDGADPECTSLDDDDESSFATGIPGDNRDAIIQDCFFDGDSGGGNDGCDIHVCCLLEPAVDCCEGDETTANDGCVEFTGPKYDPAECVQTPACQENCQPLTPPGCDCFGCCTICVGDQCQDIFTNPAIYDEENCQNIPNPTEGQCCESENLGGCYSCTKSTDCGGAACDDDPTDCILCPGQTESDLPASCGGAPECPEGVTVCEQTDDCGMDQYCTNGCCVDSIIID